MIRVEQFNALAKFSERINEVVSDHGWVAVLDTHVGTDQDGWWAVLIWRETR